MIKKLTNPSYGYVQGGSVNISCQLEVYMDDGTTLIDSYGLSCQADLSLVGLKDKVSDELARQAQEYIDRLKIVATQIDNEFGTTDFNAAIATLLTETDSKIII